MRLFVERAQAVRPEFALTEENAAAVVQVCLLFDGLPLALELAAARLATLTVQEFAARIGYHFRLLTGGGRGVPARHRSLRELVDWSYELLSEP